MKRVAIVGLGYIGLPTAILAAESGLNILGFDINEEKVNNINAGNPIILEPEIKERLLGVLKKKFFRADTQLDYADCFVLSVQTPFKENKKADLSFVWQAGKTIAERLMVGNLVIVESTVPVGTTEKLAMLLEERSGLKLSKDFFIAHCPERAIPRRMFYELINNDRIIGGFCQRSCELAQQFYAKFVTKGLLYNTDTKSAEMIKLIENSYRDVQIAYAQQVASMCYETNINPFHIINLANKHPRVKILLPSAGVGGHCISVDPWFLIETYPNSTRLLKAAREINDSKPQQIINDLEKEIEKITIKNNNKKNTINVLILGLTFKPDVDDLRESPALAIANHVKNIENNIALKVSEPNIRKEQRLATGFSFCDDIKIEVEIADIILILVNHSKFNQLTYKLFEGKRVLDYCGMLYDLQKKQAIKVLSEKNRLHFNFESFV